MKYIAHISEDKTREQPLKDHLLETADLAGSFAESFESKKQAEETAKRHDIGKYSMKGQQRMRGGPRVDHSTAGAKEIYDGTRRLPILAAYCIAGHHGGLPDGGTDADPVGTPTLRGRLKKELKGEDDYSAYREEITVGNISAPPIKPLGRGGFTLSVWARMIFSCLVDADFLNTEKFMKDGNVVRDSGVPMVDLKKKFDDHVEPWLKNTELNTVNGQRTEILKACLAAGEDEQRIYLLTVPTGGGKTISSMGFALTHAMKHGLERIVYVVPYTSIIEQNAQVFRDIFGDKNVLEDHCNVTFENEDEEKKQKLAAENYDKPIVVTTNVQFFESLFANKPSKCRKLHNLTNSVIIFDEAQMLPMDYLKPCIQMISELVYNYHCTAVLCTATQPALQNMFPDEIAGNMKEICPDVEEIYDFFQRTCIENGGRMSREQILDAIKSKKQALCILNRKKDVQEIYKRLKDEGAENIFHLSTYMYPAHRKRVLETIKRLLVDGKPCRLISTSLIEAGVDADFPMVLRELSGIDSIVQAAGRCNREGKRPKEECKTIFFKLNDDSTGKLPNSMKRPIALTEQIAQKYSNIADLSAIHEYFKRLYQTTGEGLDMKRIVKQFEDGIKEMNFPFATVASNFHLIEESTKTVLVPIEDEAKKIAESFADGQYSRQLMRKAGQYCVNLYESDYAKLLECGVIEPLFEGFAMLAQSQLEQYSEECGIKLNAELGIGHFF